MNPQFNIFSCVSKFTDGRITKLYKFNGVILSFLDLKQVYFIWIYFMQIYSIKKNYISGWKNYLIDNKNYS